MRPLGRFLALSPSDRRLLVKVALLLGGVRLGLELLPFRTVVGLLHRAARGSVDPAETPPFPPERIAWAVTRAGPYVLGSKPCLTQALTVQLLLGRRGCPSRLHLGVARGDRGEVQAHAWVEAGGTVVIGGSSRELSRYTPLLALDPRTT